MLLYEGDTPLEGERKVLEGILYFYSYLTRLIAYVTNIVKTNWRANAVHAVELLQKTIYTKDLVGLKHLVLVKVVCVCVCVCERERERELHLYAPLSQLFP